MEIKNYAQIYTSHGENFNEKDLIELNDWLSNKGIKFECEMDSDGIRLKFFKED